MKILIEFKSGVRWICLHLMQLKLNLVRLVFDIDSKLLRYDQIIDTSKNAARRYRFLQRNKTYLIPLILPLYIKYIYVLYLSAIVIFGLILKSHANFNLRAFKSNFHFFQVSLLSILENWKGVGNHINFHTSYNIPKFGQHLSTNTNCLVSHYIE